MDSKCVNWRTIFRIALSGGFWDYTLMKNAERSIITYIYIYNEHEKVVKIDSKIYSQGEGSDSPGGFRFKETARIN
jgi:hypothetical protein